MLTQRPRVAEPGEIAHVHQYAGAPAGDITLDAGNDFLAEDVFVANIRCNPLARQRHGRLAQCAPIEVAQGNVHHVHEPAKARRDELAKGHQVDLVIA